MITLELTPDEMVLLSGMGLYGAHCAGANPTLNAARYIRRIHFAMAKGSAAYDVLQSLAAKMRDAVPEGPTPDMVFQE